MYAFYNDYNDKNSICIMKDPAGDNMEYCPDNEQIVCCIKDKCCDICPAKDKNILTRIKNENCTNIKLQY
jgi:hypothetical protein